MTSRGTLAADEVFQLVGAGKTVAIAMEIKDPKAPADSDAARVLDARAVEVESFKKSLNARGKFTWLPELKLVHPDGESRTVWPSGAFEKLLSQTPPDATIVAFCLLPAQLTDSEKKLLKGRTGKLVINAGATKDVKPLIDAGLVDMGIVLRLPVPAAPADGKETPEQAVRRIYEVLKR